MAVVAWLGFAIGLHPLMLPDEGRYVGVAWEMARSGDWIVPTEDGLPFFHKPPLFYWLAALSIRTWGNTPAAARLTSVCAAWLGVMVLHVVLRRRVEARSQEGAVNTTRTVVRVAWRPRGPIVDIQC